ncbi:MAG: DUF445 domain-containing protein [Spirochaetaceae bacterium]|nr:DUF445 domain-containing protein [Spirochaetaceae bacterium]
MNVKKINNCPSLGSVARKQDCELLHRLINKSFLTNFIAAAIIAIGYFSPYYKELIISIGAFSFSAAFTNWLAIYMLFNKIPFFYGSGVVPIHFEDFKKGIKNLIMEQFFSEKNIENFAKSSSGLIKNLFTKDNIKNLIDYDFLFEKFIEAIFSTTWGAIIKTMGGVKLIQIFKGQFKITIEKAVIEMAASKKFNEVIETGILNQKQYLKDKLEEMIDLRLAELTPQMVKEIIQNMIKKHLGWLVVWGGLFGGLIGFAVGLLKKYIV